MKDRLKLPLNFDAVRLKQDLARLQDAQWINHFVKQNYDGTWSVIPLRGPAGAQHPVMMIYADPTNKHWADTPFLDKLPYFREVLATFQSPLESVRLMKLAAGSVIKEHTDLDLSFDDGHVRLHIPVTTNPAVEFVLNNQRVVMNEGECWYLRLADPHRVANRGLTDRIHMVVDLQVDPWISDLFVQADNESR